MILCMRAMRIVIINKENVFVICSIQFEQSVVLLSAYLDQIKIKRFKYSNWFLSK